MTPYPIKGLEQTTDFIHVIRGMIRRLQNTTRNISNGERINRYQYLDMKLNYMLKQREKLKQGETKTWQELKHLHL